MGGELGLRVEGDLEGGRGGCCGAKIEEEKEEEE